jgi:hypothetical protein
MTWSSAKFQADKLYPAFIGRVRELESRYGKPSIIPISIYDTDHDLAVLRPEDKGQWTAEFHASVMRAMARRLRREGYKVKLITLDAAKYLRWLASEGLKNEPQNRAAFISLQTP